VIFKMVSLEQKIRGWLKIKILVDRLLKAYNLTNDLVNNLTEDDLTLKLKNLPSNTIENQLWCIIGARESYLKAIKNEGWMGFSCSLDKPFSKDKILDCLKKSANETMEFLKDGDLNEKQLELLLILLEHEILHHGQLIRYFYGNGLPFPESWKERYTV